ncbi:MAG: hypothetical protein ACHBN1_14565 [Heteroscytonema crispum UTEX LB 1556]
MWENLSSYAQCPRDASCKGYLLTLSPVTCGRVTRTQCPFTKALAPQCPILNLNQHGILHKL